MRIGIDATAWEHPGGYGRHCRELVAALLDTPGRHVYTLLVAAAGGPPAALPVSRIELALPIEDHGVRSPAALLRAGRMLAAAPVDAWFFPSPMGFVPMFGRQQVVVTLHDTIDSRYPRSVFDGRWQQLAWRTKTALAIRRAWRIVTPSMHACRRLISDRGIAGDRIRVVGEAPAAVFVSGAPAGASADVRARLNVPAAASTVVFHGGFAPHKNVGGLLRAFRAVHGDPAFPGVHLLLVGGRHVRGPASRERAALEAFVAEHRLDRVRFAGPLDDGDLARLLADADVAVMPSFEEGYGLPAIEAAACGAAVVATTASAIPDLLGDGALYVEPGDVAALERRLRSLLSDGPVRRALAAAGQRRARALSWRDGAADLARVFDELEP